MKHSSLLLHSTWLAAALAAASLSAHVPQAVHPGADRTGKVQEAPQGLAHWQAFARDEARAIAASVGRQPISLDRGQLNSAFEGAFFDYLVSELHAAGVQLVTDHPTAAHLEIDTWLLSHGDGRHGHRLTPEERRHYASRERRIPASEAAIHVRVIVGHRVLSATSKTVYVPAAQRSLFREWHGLSDDARRVPVLGE